MKFYLVVDIKNSTYRTFHIAILRVIKSEQWFINGRDDFLSCGTYRNISECEENKNFYDVRVFN